MIVSRQYSSSSGKSSIRLSLAENARQFFVLCRQPIVELSMNECVAALTASTAIQNIVQVDSKDGRIRLFLLPGGKKWPSFYPMKQRRAADTNMFFQRVSNCQVMRFKATVDLLRKGDQVVSTGVAGIGKSTEVNAYLIEFLHHMGEKGWPPEVWYRFDGTLLKFSLKDGVPTVKETEGMALSALCQETKLFWSQIVEECPVLFLELNEEEENPVSYIATLIKLSNRNVGRITKELQKADAFYLLVDPPTCEDLCSMAVFEWRFHR